MDNTYTIKEAAELLKLHPKTVLRKIRQGDIEATRIGRQYRIARAQLEAFSGARLAAAAPQERQRRVLASCVVDVDAISAMDATRITNSAMAALNGAPHGVRLDCIYYEEVGKLKVIIHGDMHNSQQLLALVGQLLTPATSQEAMERG